MTEKEKPPALFTIQNFSSTAKLAENEIKVPIGSKETLNEKDELYNPFDHRPQEHANSTTGSFIHLIKSSLGSGILAMPHAFRHAGLILGAIGTVITGIICTHCVHILVKASHDICKTTKTPLLGFSETAEAVFKNGPKPVRSWARFAKIFVDCALVLTYFMGNSVYVVFISESISEVIGFHYEDVKEWDIRIYMALILVPLILTCQFRELKYLVPFSFFANIFMVTSFAITLKYMFEDIPDVSGREYFASIEKFPIFFSTVLFAMEGIGMVFPVANTMQKPQQFLGCPGVLNTAMSIVVVLYGTIGFFGYLKYGEKTRGSVTLNLPVEETLAQVVKILIACSVFLTFSLQFHVPMEISKKFLMPRIPQKYHNIGEIAFRTSIVIFIVGVAAAVPNLEPIIGLVGSVCFSTLGIFIPAVVDTVISWDGGLGWMKWRLYKNILLGIIAIFALGSGSFLSIKDLIEQS